MKRIVAITLLTLSTLFGSIEDIEERIYAKIFRTLIPKHQTINVYVDDPQKQEAIGKIPFVHLVPTMEQAHIIILTKPKHLSPKLCDKIILTGNYYLLKTYSSCATGGFFWHKGRPTILFLQSNLNRLHIHLPRSWKKYVEESL